MENHREEPLRRGKRAEPTAPEFVRFLHQMAKQNAEKTLKEFGKMPPMRNTVNNEIFASKTAFSKLKLTTIPELRLEESAKGEYILVRVIEEWFSIVSWNTVIEDHRGHVIRFSLYNYPTDEMLLPGDVFIIKEPYLRLPADKMAAIRCDCPTDIIVLRPLHPLYSIAGNIEWGNDVNANDYPFFMHYREQCRKSIAMLHMHAPLPTNTEQWKKKGNDFFARGKLILAREAYTFGLAGCDDSDSLVKTFRLYLLAVNLRLGYYEKVVDDAETFLRAFPQEKVAYLRLGKAYLMLRNYEKVLETYVKVCEKFPEDNDNLKELERAKERIRESNGEFNFNKLRRLSSANPLQEIDYADFCGPVQITKIAGKGRGLVLTKDVDKGNVLVVSKALAAVLDPTPNQGVQLDSGRFSLNRNEAANVAQLARLIMKNPKVFGPQVYDLYSGEDASEPAQLFCDPGVNNEPICDVLLIKTVVDCNSFQIVEKMQDGEIMFKGGGLFRIPSYINHSCSPNTNADFFNDIMVVKASRDMKEGTELTITYVPPDLSFEERTQIIAERGFKCSCEKCKRRC